MNLFSRMRSVDIFPRIVVFANKILIKSFEANVLKNKKRMLTAIMILKMIQQITISITLSQKRFFSVNIYKLWSY